MTRDETPEEREEIAFDRIRSNIDAASPTRDETPRDPLRPLPWADNAAAALDELDRLYYDGAGPTVAEYRAATDAVRTAIDALASSTPDAAPRFREDDERRWADAERVGLGTADYRAAILRRRRAR